MRPQAQTTGQFSRASVLSPLATTASPQGTSSTAVCFDYRLVSFCRAPRSGCCSPTLPHRGCHFCSRDKSAKSRQKVKSKHRSRAINQNNKIISRDSYWKIR